MVQPQFRFYLMQDATTYFVAAGGAVTTTTTATPIRSAPKNWEQTRLSWQRNTKYHGIFRTITTPYQWVRDGAAIMRHVYYTQGIEGKCLLRIDMRDKTGAYNTFFAGEIDFSQVSDTRDFFGANVLESGLAAVLKANESTPCEIPLEGGTSLRVNMDGMTLQDKLSYVTVGRALEYGWHASKRVCETMAFVAQEASYHIGETQSPQSPFIGTLPAYQGFEGDPIPDADTLWFYEASGTKLVAIRYRQQFQYATGDAGDPDCKLRVKYWICAAGSDTPYADGFIFLDPGQADHSYRTVDIDATTAQFTLNDGDRLYIFWSVRPVTLGNFFYTVGWTDGTCDLLVELELPASKVRAYRQRQLWTKLIGQATTYGGASSFLFGTTPLVDNKPWNTVITCGDALRGIYTNVLGEPAEPRIRTTIAEYFQHLQSLYPVGTGISGNTAYLEDLGFFYQAGTMIADLGEVSDLEIVPLTEWFWNTAKAGYQTVDTDNLNGRNEYNATTTWKLPITRVTGKELDLVSPYIAGIYAIEYTRANLLGKKASGKVTADGDATTDGNTDNDTFVLSIEDSPQGDGSYNLKRLAIGSGTPAGTVSGILFPARAFNLDLTPARNLERNEARLKITTHLISGKPITWQTSEKNNGLVSRFPGSAEITEKADKPTTTGDARLWLPMGFKFKVPSPVNLKPLLDTNPYGYFSFKWKGAPLKMYLIESGLVPATGAVQDWTGIAHPDCDLSALHG